MRDELIQTLSLAYGEPTGKVEKALSPGMIETLDCCYLSRRLDSVCSGPNRHEAFGKWARDNWPTVARYHRMRVRPIMREISALRDERTRLKHRIEYLAMRT